MFWTWFDETICLWNIKDLHFTSLIQAFKSSKTFYTSVNPQFPSFYDNNERVSILHFVISKDIFFIVIEVITVLLCVIVKFSSQENRQHFWSNWDKEEEESVLDINLQKNHTPSRVKSIWLVSDCLFPNDFISGLLLLNDHCNVNYERLHKLHHQRKW